MVTALTDEKLRLFKIKFRKYCKQAEVTQRQLADVIGIAYGYFSEKLNGSYRLSFFTPKQLAQMIDYLARNEAFYTEEEKLELLRLVYPTENMQAANDWFKQLVKAASEPPVFGSVVASSKSAYGKLKTGGPSKTTGSITLTRVQRHYIPTADNVFIGREKELKEITDMLTAPPGASGSSRLVTLSGTGGVGKTRLALEILHKLKARRLFKSGIKFIDLSEISSGHEAAWQVARRIAQTVELPIPDSLLTELNLAARQVTLSLLLASHLQEKNMLIVLDNFEQLLADDTAGLVTEMLTKCPRLKILITSREALRTRHERIIRLKGLAVPPESELDLAKIAGYPAVTLLIARLQERQGGFELTAENALPAAQICRLLSGLPLAIEIAARHIEYFSLERLRDIILAELEGRAGGHGFSFLASCLGCLRAGVVRHRTLQASLDWSFALLTDHEKKLLGSLARLKGDFTLEAVTATHAGSWSEGEPKTPKSVVELLGALVDKNLIQVENVLGNGLYQADTLYTIPGLVACYAQNWLPEIVDKEHGNEIAAIENEAGITVAKVEQAGTNPAVSKTLPVVITRRKKTTLEFIAASTALQLRTAKNSNREGFNIKRLVNCGLSPPVQC